MNVEQELRRALRPADPGPRFTDRVVALARSGAGRPVEPVPAARKVLRRAGWMMAALAASVMLATSAGLAYLQYQRWAEARAAHGQLVAALKFVSAEFDEVQRKVAGRNARPATQPRNSQR